MLHLQLDQLASTCFPITRNNATVAGNLNRFGPALPGFRNSTPFFRSIDGVCECPPVTAANPSATESMLAKATENAKLRAENMAKGTGNRMGVIRSAKMDVFQIAPINSNDVTDYGMNDLRSLEKKVTAVVSATFAIA